MKTNKDFREYCEYHQMYRKNGTRWVFMSSEIKCEMEKHYLIHKSSCDKCTPLTGITDKQAFELEGEYELLLNFGMMWEFYPQMKGNWREDYIEFIKEKRKEGWFNRI